MSNPSIKPTRRIVTVEDSDGTSIACADGPSPDVRTDPARPGFASTRIWLTEGTPAPIVGVRETLDLAHSLRPPSEGSVCRVLTIPPDTDNVTEGEVRAYFETMGSPDVCRCGDGTHPYMQCTDSLDFCIVLEGEITLVLDMEEVSLKAEDTVILQGGNHAWSNRSDRSCRLFISQHDGTA
ncbi:MAG: cupin domain-containing protein [Proteobacteria bacterium]|nr:cupin domain-containing protein [Pseudomonadota bacterium]